MFQKERMCMHQRRRRRINHKTNLSLKSHIRNGMKKKKKISNVSIFSSRTSIAVLVQSSTMSSFTMQMPMHKQTIDEQSLIHFTARQSLSFASLTIFRYFHSTLRVLFIFHMISIVFFLHRWAEETANTCVCKCVCALNCISIESQNEKSKTIEKRRKRWAIHLKPIIEWGSIQPAS